MNRSGISLIELLTTIAIIILLVGISVPAISFIKDNSKKAKTKAEIKQLDTALLAFFTENGSYPKTGQLLASLSEKYFSFDPSRIKNGAYLDPWGEPYIYISPSSSNKKGYELYSIGMMSATTGSSNITSDSEKDVIIGNPSGQGDKTVWNLREPEYDALVKAALGLLRGTDKGYNLAVMINIANVPIHWGDLSNLKGSPIGFYYPYPDSENYGIWLDISLQDGPAEAIAAVLAHEATHLADHLASGDMDYDSIEEEYDAFYNAAMVWEQLTKGKTFTNLNDSAFVNANPTYVKNINYQKEKLALIKQGSQKVREVLRKDYPQWPEKDQWGDSYVVAKKY